MSVIFEHNGPVTSLIIDRPALAEALRAFEADEQTNIQARMKSGASVGVRRWSIPGLHPGYGTAGIRG